MAPKDSRYSTITAKKLREWSNKHDRVQNGIVEEKRGRKVILDFENDIWAELLLCAIEMKEEDEKMEETVEVLFNVCYSYNIMDNVSSHKVDLLDAIFKEANVQVDYFPPNMTQFLQVLDLIINGPLKAHVRRNGSFVKFTYKPSGGTTSVAPTGTNKKYSKSQYDADVPESERNEQYSPVVDIIDEWMFDESLDDFDPGIFDDDEEHNNLRDDSD